MVPYPAQADWRKRFCIQYFDDWWDCVLEDCDGEHKSNQPDGKYKGGEPNYFATAPHHKPHNPNSDDPALNPNAGRKRRERGQWHDSPDALLLF